MVFRGQSEGKSIFAAFGWGKFWGEQQAAAALVAAACIFPMAFRVLLVVIDVILKRYGDDIPLFRNAAMMELTTGRAALSVVT
jgi:hypothetical protein